MKPNCTFFCYFLTALLVIVLVSILPLCAAQAQAPGVNPLDAFAQMADSWTADESNSSQPSPSELPQPDSERVVYLTFDDGPDPHWTPKIQEQLNRFQAKGTFFVIGRNVVTFPDVVAKLAQDGNTFGNHSFSHQHIAGFGYNDFYAEVANTTSALKSALQADPELVKLVTPCLRPPFGEVSPSLYQHAGQMGYAISMWDIDTHDWMGISDQSILTEVLANLQPHKIILFHDGGVDRENTVQALGLVLHELTQLGYTFQPLCTQQGQVRY
ncbi:MAG: polysaccharide deacetylase family protein [Anaerolineaceae bacterium]|jgi:peptidoglycan/xylan/chitin deacetylase (PgdA/CDA1 family)